ncbi:MAG: trigger factor [Candidatus Gastranaerophilales bacterium]|nr:trigger factor [Candidatus Gastranaerophilales bacterium]
MEIKVEKNKNNTVATLEITFDDKEAQKAYDIACRQIANSVNIPGFRRGKAPKHILEKHVGADYIKREAIESLLPKAFHKAIIDNNLDILVEPAVTDYKFEKDEPVFVKAEVELRPEVKIENYKDLTFETEKYTRKENDVQEELDNLVKKSAELKTATHETANAEDIVVIDFKGFIEGEPIEHGDGKDYLLDLANSAFIPGFAEAIVGHNLNEEFDINVKFPDDYHDEKIKGKDAVFNIKINEIKERILPELNDEFAKKVSSFETLEELKADIEKYLKEYEEKENIRRREKKIFDEVMKLGEVEVTDAMVERESRNILNEYAAKFQGGSGVEFGKLLEAKNPELMENIKEEAKNRIKNTLIIAKIAQNENIQVTPQELQSKIEELAYAYNTGLDVIYEEIRKNSNIIHGIGQQALMDKVSKFLAEKNTVNLV